MRSVVASACPASPTKLPAEERRTILERFRPVSTPNWLQVAYSTKVSMYPDCRVAIIVSGNSTKREYIQRLGRILRPKAGQALLYELITTGTTEEEIAKRRK